jgi:ATP-dependent Clp protease ATP-binding subunit ClpC
MDKFSPRVKDVITFSREEALRLGHDYIGVEHLLLGLIREGEGKAIKLMRNMGVEVKDVRKMIEKSLTPGKNKSLNLGTIPLLRQAEKVLKYTVLEAKVFKSDTVGTEHLLLAILKDDDNVASQVLNRFNIDYEVAKTEINNLMKEKDEPEDYRTYPRADMSNPADDDDEGAGESFTGNPRKTDSKSKTPVLDNFGRDLTKLAEESKLDPIVGRDKEIERVCQILSRRKKNNPILIGEPGVGKSAIAEGLALRIVQRKVSRLISVLFR